MIDRGGADASDGSILRIAIKIEDAPIVTGASRSRIYGAIRQKKLTARKAGRSTIILIDGLAAWLRSLPAVGKPPETGTAA
jgi:hypothetical protein